MPSQKDEAQRLQALLQYEILDTPPDPALDDIARLAAQFCSTPIALISLVDSNRVWYKSAVGVEVRSVHRAASACPIATQHEGVTVFEDTAQERLFEHGAILIGKDRLRFYAGAPLISPEGIAIGALCVLDYAPRSIDATQTEALAILARQVITRLELNTKLRSLERSARAKQRIEQALTVERNFVSAVLDTMGALVLVFDTAGRVVRFNRACETISGYSFAELVGRPFWEKLIPAEDVRDAIYTFESIRSGNFPAAYEREWLTRSGHHRRIAWNGTALLDAHGEVAFVISTGIDITEQRKAETTLRESEARYRQLIESALGLICTHDLSGILLSINTHAAENLGYEAEELIGQPIYNFIPPEHYHGYESYAQAMSDRGEDQGMLYLTHRNGDTRVIAYRNKLIQIEGREPFVLGHGIDVTEKNDAEEALRQLSHQSASILESAGDGICGYDLDGRISFINNAAVSMLGYEFADELTGRFGHDVFHHSKADGRPLSYAECRIHRSIAHMKQTRVDDEVFWRKDGTSFPVEYVACPQIDNGRPVGVVVVFQDVTERRALDRMKDEFISTVSHELRTPLTSLRAALGLITGGALQSRPDKITQMLEVAMGNTDRLVTLVNDILDLERISSGKLDLHLVPTSAIALLERTASLQQSSASRAGIHFSIEAPRDLLVYADFDRILQTLTNLVGNAIKFSPQGGNVRLYVRVTGPNEATFSVHDHGRGIPPEKLEMIFERFQQVDASDSRSMGGTGLGLAICRSIVQQHGGRIWAESSQGAGASFFFTIPLRQQSPLVEVTPGFAVAVGPAVNK